MKQSNILKKKENIKKQPSEEEAKEAVKTLISWAGDDPNREGFVRNAKVINAKRVYAGYYENPDEILSKTFEEVADSDEMVIVKDIKVESHCEHHMVPILGIALCIYTK